MTGASSGISTPASRAARAARQGRTRRANHELALLGVAVVGFVIAAFRLTGGHLLDAPGATAEADIERTWLGFTMAFAKSGAFLVGGFAVAHVVRRLRGAIGDPWLLPIACALCGLGMLTMASVNDPWRERLLFQPFAVGVALGCVALTAASLVDFARLELHRFAFLFLCAALGLSVLLLVFGSGPGRSGVKVNLLGVQPVEAIRPLIALFLAGYFARRWEWLRELGEPLARQHPLLARLQLPRVSDLIPVAIGMALVLLFFFFQRDLGPALVISCTFLVTYSVARDRWGLAALGLVVLVGAFTAAYVVGYPSTVVKRIDMWQSPWDNGVSGGDQVAHALWGLASGGLFGGGLAETSARYIPTGENDLVLASLGENLGFVGVLVVLALFGTLVVRGLRIARRTDQPYVALLVVGLVTSLAAQAILIVGGLLGLLPLSGVVTPFLSLGRSSMISNLAVVGLLIAASRQSPPGETRPFLRPASRVALAVGVMLAIAATRAFWVQVATRGDVMTRQTKTRQADGAIRAQDNPRLREAARLIRRGSILDRRGVPIAMDSSLDLTKFTKDYAAMGVTPCPTAARQPAAAGAARQPVERCYPLGGAAFHLLGDSVSKANWAATNSAFAERDFDTRLRGYEDYSQLTALWDHRHEPYNPLVRAIIDRPRDVQLTIDARLQARTSALLARKLGDLGLVKGAIVVMDVATGDVLASVSAPWPRLDRSRVALEEDAQRPELPLLDRARYGQYPPGSTFKLVTAAAALRDGSGVAERHFECKPLDDGRVGMQLRGWRRPVRDDETDRVAHGDVTLDEGIRVSCNAYFAQLGMAVGARSLKETADAFEIITAAGPGTADHLKNLLPWASYGQGEVLASPFRMARVAATMAAHGNMPAGRWVLSPVSGTPAAPRHVIQPAAAERVARAMRRVVTAGTASSLAGHAVEIAGKTGTAEVGGAASHSWFVGFAPTTGTKRIAVAVIVENGGYGARAAVPLAGEVVTAARSLQLIP